MDVQTTQDLYRDYLHYKRVVSVNYHLVTINSLNENAYALALEANG